MKFSIHIVNVINLFNLVNTKGYSLKDALKTELLAELQSFHSKPAQKYVLPEATKNNEVYEHIKDYLNTGQLGELGTEINTDNDRLYRNEMKKRFKHRTLVKRLLPRGFTNTKPEYDSEFHTYYKPLLKIHKSIRRPLSGKSERNELERIKNEIGLDENLQELYKIAQEKLNGAGEKNDPSQNSKGSFEIVNRPPVSGNVKSDVGKLYLNTVKALQKDRKETKGKIKGNIEIVNRIPVFGDKKIDEELLRPFKYKKRVTFQSILNDIQTYIHRVHNKAEIRRLKYAVLKVLENYNIEERLRSIPTKSEERDNPGLAKYYEELITHEHEETKKKKTRMPNYPYWNWWTYKKSIYHDKCKGKLVQWGNRCLETPPH